MKNHFNNQKNLKIIKKLILNYIKRFINYRKLNIVFIRGYQKIFNIKEGD